MIDREQIKTAIMRDHVDAKNAVHTLTDALRRAASVLDTLSDTEPHELDLATAIAKREAGLVRDALREAMR